MSNISVQSVNNGVVVLGGTAKTLKDINVQVKNCMAWLSGTVPSGMQRLEAAVVARSTQGVCSVQDDIRVSD